MYGTRNFYINYKDPKGNRDVSLGVWHVLPNHVVRRFARALNITPKILGDLHVDQEAEKIFGVNTKKYAEIEKNFGEDFNAFENESNQKKFFESILRDTEGPVILYLHGNTCSRGALHRVEMYQRMRELGFHVIAFDYRGYADSSKIGPSSRAVRQDAEIVLDYILDKTNDPILLWGHSLGTGIATLMMSELQNSKKRLPFGVVLESPFNNMREEVTEHPFARLFRHLPWFKYTIIEPMQRNSLTFDSDKCIRQIKEPIMIMHAEDDHVVPFRLGYKVNFESIKLFKEFPLKKSFKFSFTEQLLIVDQVHLEWLNSIVLPKI